MAEKIRRQDVIAKDNRRIAISLLGQGFPEKALSYAQNAVEIMTRLQDKNLEKAQATLKEIENRLSIDK